jgi:uncharacterized protein YlxP (DUF503 family)
MIVGAALVELHVHGSRSLKEKRGVVRSISRRLRNRLNVSVAEIGGQDTWQRAVLGITTTASSAPHVRGVLEGALRFIDELHLAEITGSDIELLEMNYEGTGIWTDVDDVATESDSLPTSLGVPSERD